MPSTKQIGQASEANKKIGGVPTLHYFDFQSRGRGQVVRLLWEDAGIAYEDIRYTFEEYPEYKKSKIAQLNPTATIPVIELDGRILTQSYAILRRFARQLGAYDGETEEEKYWADAICDIASDCKSTDAFPFLIFIQDLTRYRAHIVHHRLLLRQQRHHLPRASKRHSCQLFAGSQPAS